MSTYLTGNQPIQHVPQYVNVLLVPGIRQSSGLPEEQRACERDCHRVNWVIHIDR